MKLFHKLISLLLIIVSILIINSVGANVFAVNNKQILKAENYLNSASSMPMN